MGWAPRDRPDTPARSRSAGGAATYSCRRPAPPTPPPRSPAPGAPTGPADPAGRAPRCLHRPSGPRPRHALVEQHPHPHEPLVDAIPLEARVVQHALAVGPQPLSRRDERRRAVASGGRPSAWLLLASAARSSRSACRSSSRSLVPDSARPDPCAAPCPRCAEAPREHPGQIAPAARAPGRGWPPGRRCGSPANGHRPATIS